MNYWIISDTHFGHDKMYDYCGRPKGFETLFLNNIHKVISGNDVLIHLGDICFGNDSNWHKELCSIPCATRWLVRGNHDKKSITWHINNGWQFVADCFTLNAFGLKIVFSHMPHNDTGYDLNIHGHFHNVDYHWIEPELLAIKNSRQFLIASEYEKYRPVNLKTIIKRYKRGK